MRAALAAATVAASRPRGNEAASTITALTPVLLAPMRYCAVAVRGETLIAQTCVGSDVAAEALLTAAAAATKTTAVVSPLAHRVVRDPDTAFAVPLILAGTLSVPAFPRNYESVIWRSRCPLPAPSSGCRPLRATRRPPRSCARP